MSEGRKRRYQRKEMPGRKSSKESNPDVSKRSASRRFRKGNRSMSRSSIVEVENRIPERNIARTQRCTFDFSFSTIAVGFEWLPRNNSEIHNHRDNGVITLFVRTFVSRYQAQYRNLFFRVAFFVCLLGFAGFLRALETNRNGSSLFSPRCEKMQFVFGPRKSSEKKKTLQKKGYSIHRSHGKTSS